MDDHGNATQNAIPPASFTLPPNQHAILDLLIPGFSNISQLISTYTGQDINLYIPILVLLFSSVWAIQTAWTSSWRFFRKYCMTSAEVRIDDEMYNHVMGWIAAQPFSSRSKMFVAQSSSNSRSWYMIMLDRFGNRDKEEEEEEEDVEVGDDGLPMPKRRREKPISYTPGMGTHLFWWRYRPFLFHRYVAGNIQSYELPSQSEEISISSFGRDPKVLKELLAECKALSSKADRDKTLIYRGSSRPGSNGSEFSWIRSLSRVARPINSVVMDEDTKREVLEDIAEYLSPRTRRWYANRGIPYRRGYLLYGAPGTGKSSLSLALAGRFRLPIYIASLNSPMMDEENLASLFSELPSRCVVLLEDIDTAGLTHTRDDTETENVAVKSKSSKSGKSQVALVAKKGSKGKISLSALLNVLDGVASQEGRVLIMTTNHIDKLDEALIRPGRVDMKIEFRFADRAMMAALFRSIYTKFEGDDAKLPPRKELEMKARMNGSSLTSAIPLFGKRGVTIMEDGKSAEAEEKKVVEEKEAERIKVLAEQFADVMPQGEFSPAEVQGYLLKIKRHPERAIKGAEQWAIDTRAEKKKRAEKEKLEQEAKEAKEKKEKKEKLEKEEEAKKNKKKSTNGKKKEGSSTEDE